MATSRARSSDIKLIVSATIAVVLAGLFIAGGLLTLLTVPVVRWLGPGARGDGDLAALGITLIDHLIVTRATTL